MSYLDTNEFAKYTARIEKILRASRKPLSIGDIHRKLGDKANRAWTMGALDNLSTESVGILPTTYRISDRKPLTESKRFWNGTLPEYRAEVV